MERRGRTQRKDPGEALAAPQRMLFGQGKARMMPGRISASNARVSMPSLSISAKAVASLPEPRTSTERPRSGSAMEWPS